MNTRTVVMGLLTGAMVFSTGCGVQRVFYHARPVPTVHDQTVQVQTMQVQTVRVARHSQVVRETQDFADYHVVLAAEFSGGRLVMQPTPPPDADSANQPTRDGHGGEDEKGEVETSDQKSPPIRPYTAPGTQVQRMTLIVLGLSAFGTTDEDESGKELAQSMVSVTSATPFSGRLGLTGTSAITDVTGVRLGLQQGVATGIGFANPDRNIFTARANPLTGATGRCQDLVNAGFFNRDAAACAVHFGGR